MRLQAESHDLVPEEVVVLETVGAIEDFIRAVEKVPGMEWLAELDDTDVRPDEDFFETTSKGERRPDKTLRGRLFMVFTNQDASQQLLSLWQTWQEDDGKLPHGLEGESSSDFVGGASLEIQVNCRADAGALEEEVPYALVSTIEVTSDLWVSNIYDEVRAGVQAARLHVVE